jgi:hypothetical protein
MIARAAGHKLVARVLAEEEAKRGIAQKVLTPFAKAYLLTDLRAFPGWTEAAPAAPLEEPLPEGATVTDAHGADEIVVYVHRDFTVTRSIWSGEDVIYDRVTPEWIAYCETVLGFYVPEDID